jgi:single-stranded DNA-binding protein
MNYIDNLNVNEATVTGVMVGDWKTFPHRANLRTLQISSGSFGKTFYDDKREAHRERLMIELHDNAAEKAEYYQSGDILHIRGQLAVRRWTDSHGVPQIRVVIVVEDHRKVNKLGESNSSPVTQETVSVPDSQVG